MVNRKPDNAINKLLSIVTISLVLAALYFAKEIILPFFLAILLGFLLNPLVRRVERLKIPRLPAVLIVAVIAFSAIGFVGWLVTSQVVDLSTKLPDYKGNLIEKIQSVRGVTRGRIEKATETIAEIGEELSDDNAEAASTSMKIEQPNAVSEVIEYLKKASVASESQDPRPMEVKVISMPPSPLNQLQTWLGPLVAPLTTAGVVIVLTLFMLLKREDLRNRMIQLAGTNHLRTTTEALDEATGRITSFLRMQLIINSIYGLFLGVGLYLIGVPNALLWGVLGLLLRFLPYIGPWIVAAMPITLSLAVFDDWTHVILTLMLFVTLEITVNNVLEPWLYGASMGVSSVGIIMSAIFWMWLWGPIGLVLAMPLTVCLVVAGNYVPQFNLFKVLLGEGSLLTIEEEYYQRLLALDLEDADRLIDVYMNDGSQESLYEDVLIPALRLAEKDRHDGVLSDRQELILTEATRDFVNEYSSSHEATASDGSTESPSRSNCVLCIPARDDADEITSLMVSQLLTKCGIRNETRTNDFLASELVALADSNDVDAVVISALPPDASRHARYLCKKLRARLPHLPIIVGLWGGSNLTSTHTRLVDSGATSVAYSLADAVNAVKSLVRIDKSKDTP